MPLTQNLMKSVLLVEDDRDIKGLIDIHLIDLGCKLTQAVDGEEGYKLAIQQHFDLIILDVMLPNKNGLDICRDLRANQVKTPILMLSARSEEIDKIMGLENGADDYLTKPFSVHELKARVKALFRRVEMSKNNEPEQSPVEVEGLSIDPIKRKVIANNERIELTPKEFDLLWLLASNPGKSFTRQRLLDIIWEYDFDGYEHTVNSHINRLRAKIEKDLSNPNYILTSWGMGYRFNDELSTRT
ncbi:MAG: response regulator transcription factor [Fulvivirga sp.]